MPFLRRLAVTVLVPLAFALFGDRLLLPGVSSDVVARMPGSHANLSVFAMGLAPVVKTTISGGRLTVTMGAHEDPEQGVAEAKELAKRLRP